MYKQGTTSIFHRSRFLLVVPCFCIKVKQLFEDFKTAERTRAQCNTHLADAWHYTGRQSLARTFVEILRTGAARKMAFPSTLALLGKALVTVETVGLSLYPDFDIETEFRPFFFEVVKDWLSPEKTLRTVKSDMLNYAHALQELPRRVFEVTDTLARGEVSIKIDQSELRSLLDQMRRTSVAQIVGHLGLATIIASAVAFHAVGHFRAGCSSYGCLACRSRNSGIVAFNGSLSKITVCAVHSSSVLCILARLRAQSHHLSRNLNKANTSLGVRKC